MMKRLFKRIWTQYAPQIKEHTAPLVVSELEKLTDQYKCLLTDGEDSVNYVVRKQNGKFFLFICTMDHEDRVVRTLDVFTIDQLVEKAVALADKIEVL